MRTIRSGKSRWMLAMAATGLLATCTAFAQGQRTNPPGAGAPPTARPAAQPGRLDKEFAACLTWANENEVAAARLAEKKAKSPEVRDFAKKLAADHSKFIQDLEQFAGPLAGIRQSQEGAARPDGRPGADGRAVPPAGRQPANPPNTQVNPNQVNPPNNPAATAEQRARPGAAATLTAGGEMDEMLHIKAEIADACRASVEKELGGKSGNEFDDCYVGMQIAAHMAMVDELKVLERHASPQLQQVLRQGRSTAESHLEHAKKIMKSLDRSQTAQKPDDSTIK